MKKVEDKKRSLRGYSLDEMAEILDEAAFSDFKEEDIYPGSFYKIIRVFNQLPFDL